MRPTPTRSRHALTVGLITIPTRARRAPRDLYDLAALARGGMVTAEAAELALGVCGLSVTRTLFSQQPAGDWEGQLAY